MPGIGVITNPRSRQNKRRPEGMRQLGYLIGSAGNAEATQTLDDLYRAAEVFKNERIDILGINGGDGTIHHTLTAFIKIYGETPLPKVALLRGGTMNTIANSLGVKGEPQKLLYELIDKYKNAPDSFVCREKRILAVGDAYGFIFGSGIPYNFLEAYYATGRPSPSTAALLLARAIGSAMVGGPLAARITRRVHARVTVDGDRWAREDFTAIVASTVRELGLGFTPFYRADESNDAFPILGIHASPVGVAVELPRIFRALPIRRDRAIDALAREVTLEGDELDYIVDGDTYKCAGQLAIRLGPTLTLVMLTGRATDEAELEPPARTPTLHD